MLMQRIPQIPTWHQDVGAAQCATLCLICYIVAEVQTLNNTCGTDDGDRHPNLDRVEFAIANLLPFAFTVRDPASVSRRPPTITGSQEPQLVEAVWDPNPTSFIFRSLLLGCSRLQW